LNPQPSDPLFHASEMAKLRNMSGDKTDERIALGRSFIRHLEKKSPGIVHVLNSGLGNNSGIVAMVVAHAERWLIAMEIQNDSAEESTGS
jgi:hypothetical protein